MQGKMVLAPCYANKSLRKLKSIALGSALVAAPLALALILAHAKS